MAALDRMTKGPRISSELSRKFPTLQTIIITSIITLFLLSHAHHENYSQRSFISVLYQALWILLAAGFRSNLCQNDNPVHITNSVRARWEEDLLDAFDPLVFLLCRRRWDAVECVVSFHNPSICFSLTCFDDLILVVWDEEFKAVLCKESYFRRGFYPEELVEHLSQGYFPGANRGYKNNGASVWEIFSVTFVLMTTTHIIKII